MQIKLADLNDWMIVDKAGPKGDFTIAVMKQASERTCRPCRRLISRIQCSFDPVITY